MFKRNPFSVLVSLRMEMLKIISSACDSSQLQFDIFQDNLSSPETSAQEKSSAQQASKAATKQPGIYQWF